MPVTSEIRKFIFQIFFINLKYTTTTCYIDILFQLFRIKLTKIQRQVQ